MKLCAVYRSTKRADTYLYLPKRDAFEDIPNALLKQFGKPLFVMMLALDKHKLIAKLEKESFVSQLMSQGYYLQLPPSEKNLLAMHRESMGLPQHHDKSSNE